MVTRAGRGLGRAGAANPKSFVALVLVLILAGAGGLAYLTGRRRGPAATTVDPNLPPAVAKGYTRWAGRTPRQILEFADFECPACGNYSVVTEPDVRKRIIEPGLARVTYYDFPLPQHKNTLSASESAACANDQGKFWEMHDRLFQGQTDWNTEATSDPVSVMQGYAKAIGLDVDKWRACVDSRTHEREILANKAEGRAAPGESDPDIRDREPDGARLADGRPDQGLRRQRARRRQDGRQHDRALTRRQRNG